MSGYREHGAVRVSYVLEAEEIEREFGPLNREQLHAPRLAVAATVALGSAVYLFTLPWGWSHGAIVAACALITWLMVKMRPKTDVASVFGDTWEERRRVSFEADEDGLAMGDDLSEERVAWELVLAWQEAESSFRIHTGPQAAHTIPKRVFTEDQRTTLRRLLTDRVRPGGDAKIAAYKRTSWVPWAVYLVALTLVLMSCVEAVARIFS